MVCYILFGVLFGVLSWLHIIYINLYEYKVALAKIFQLLLASWLFSQYNTRQT